MDLVAIKAILACKVLLASFVAWQLGRMAWLMLRERLNNGDGLTEALALLFMALTMDRGWRAATDGMILLGLIDLSGPSSEVAFFWATRTAANAALALALNYLYFKIRGADDE